MKRVGNPSKKRFRTSRNDRRWGLHTFLFTILLSAGLLLIVGALPALAFPGPDKAKGIIVQPGDDRPSGIINSQSTIDPVIKLTEYQRRWIKDRSKLKIGKFTRQGGKSFIASLEAVLDCYEVESKGQRTTWVFLSAGERQSKELMAAAAIHARAINIAIKEVEDTFKAEDNTTFKQLEIIFPGGSRIIGLPANPSTARGLSANVLLDEFAFHKDSRAIWKALYPTITRGYKIRIISTPQGRKNRFYEIWTGRTLQIWDGPELYEHKGERGGWSKHNVTIIDAFAMGLEVFDEDGNPVDAEELRLGLNDDEAWQQEYMVEFLDEATAWLPYDLIEGVEEQRILAEPSWVERLVNEAVEHYEQYKSNEVIPAYDSSWLKEVPWIGDHYIGFDVARRRDLSVIWLDEEVENLYWTRAAIGLKKQPFGVQRIIFFSLMKLPNFRRACIDKTGIGEEMYENASRVFSSRVEGIDFNIATKETLAHGIKRSFTDQRDRIPADNTIRQSLHSVKQTPTDTGHFRFDADRTDAVGHADHFWAKALAVLARNKKAGGPIHVISRGRRETSGMMKGYE